MVRNDFIFRDLHFNPETLDAFKNIIVNPLAEAKEIKNSPII